MKKLYDLVSCGRACVDDSFLVPSVTGERGKTPILKSYVSGGGQAATCAVVVAQMGGKSAFVGNLGRDSYGELIRDELESFGVDTSLVDYPEGYKTPRAIILVDQESGERQIYYEPTDENYSIPLTEEILKNARSVILDPQIKPEELHQVMKWCPKDCIVVYDAERPRPSLQEMKSYADFFIASETILDIPVNGKINRWLALEQLQEEVKGELIVTFGEHGSVWMQEGSYTLVPAPEVKAVDTTGAGDVYHAAFAYYQPQIKDIVETMKVATLCAALSTTYPGTRGNMPFQEFLEGPSKKFAKVVTPKILSVEQLKEYVA